MSEERENYVLGDDENGCGLYLTVTGRCFHIRGPCWQEEPNTNCPTRRMYFEMEEAKKGPQIETFGDLEDARRK